MYVNKILSQSFNIWNNKIAWKHWKKVKKDKNGENVSHLEIT